MKMTVLEAKAILDEVSKVAQKVMDSKMSNVVYTVPAVVKAVSGTSITVLPTGFADDSSQYIVVKNYTNNTISVGDDVWINYWGDFTNAYLSPASF